MKKAIAGRLWRDIASTEVNDDSTITALKR